jgi:F0F1-type ATP synthase assembly protein I
VAKVPRRPESQKNQASFLRKAGLYLGVAFELPGTILAGLVIGYYADDYFDSSPWMLLICTALAFIGAFVRLVQWVKVFARERDGIQRTEKHYPD